MALVAEEASSPPSNFGEGHRCNASDPPDASGLPPDDQRDEVSWLKPSIKMIAYVDIGLSLVELIWVLAIITAIVFMVGRDGDLEIKIADDANKIQNPVYTYLTYLAYRAAYSVIKVYLGFLLLYCTFETVSTREALADARMWCFFKVIIIIINAYCWGTAGGVLIPLLTILWIAINLRFIFFVWHYIIYLEHSLPTEYETVCCEEEEETPSPRSGSYFDENSGASDKDGEVIWELTLPTEETS